MPRPKRWTLKEIKDGIGYYELSSWRWFADFVNQVMLDYRQYVFRGHSSHRWKLETTLDRALKRLPRNRRISAREEHLPNFKLASRGRRGRNPADLNSDDEWWALGQHHGLNTPLLDWTESPFVALYFAFAEVDTDGAENRAVWAINPRLSSRFNELVQQVENEERLGDLFGQEINVVRPHSDENARLVNQRGLFIRIPTSHTLEEVVSSVFPGEVRFQWLIKLSIPNTDRTVCLRALNRMNINHLSLFPDLTGASIHSNTDLRIKNY